MKTTKINEKIEIVLTPRWWNPLSWIVTGLAPVLGIVVGIVSGCLVGLLVGFQKELELSNSNMEKILKELS